MNKKINSRLFLKIIILYIIFLYYYNEFSKIKFFNNKKNKKKTIQNNPKYLRIKYQQFTQELPHYNHTHQNSNKIFWCWLQGEEKAPDLSKACLNSIRRYCTNYEIIIINENNINNYVHFPPFVMNKYKCKYFTKTHFSDLLRLELLIKYGGTWIDSTVLITKFDKTFFNKDLFFFQVSKPNFLVGSSWFLSSEKESPILKTTRDLLYEFWAKNNILFHYYLFHFFFKISCDKYKNDYKNVPWYSNIPVHNLQWELFKPYNYLRYKHIISKASIHKLTFKHTTNKKKGLVYHHILKLFPISQKSISKTISFNLFHKLI